MLGLSFTASFSSGPGLRAGSGPRSSSVWNQFFFVSSIEIDFLAASLSKKNFTASTRFFGFTATLFGFGSDWKFVSVKKLCHRFRAEGGGSFTTGSVGLGSSPAGAGLLPKILSRLFWNLVQKLSKAQKILS